jgi:hypothetical protein
MHAPMQVGAAGHISALALSPRGNRLVANCSDRCARLLEVLPPAPGQPRFAPAEAAARIRTAKVRPPAAHKQTWPAETALACRKIFDNAPLVSAGTELLTACEVWLGASPVYTLGQRLSMLCPANKWG